MDENILAIGSSVNQNKPFRKSMDDTNVILESFGKFKATSEGKGARANGTVIKANETA